MKSLLVSTASAVGVLAALCAPASAQLASIDLDAVLGLPGTVVGAIGDIDVLPSGLEGLLPVSGTQIAGNTAVNVAPAVSVATQIAVPLDADGILAAGLAAGGGITPNTTSVAAAIAAIDIARLGGSNVAGDVTQTTFGVLGDQVSQSALVSSAASAADVSLSVGLGTTTAVDEASNAAASVGSSTSQSAARYASVEITSPTFEFTDNSVSEEITSAIGGLYQGNIAVNLAPALSVAAQVGTANTVGNLTQTTFGILGTQISSVGIDAAGVAAAIKGD